MQQHQNHTYEKSRGSYLCYMSYYCHNHILINVLTLLKFEVFCGKILIFSFEMSDRKEFFTSRKKIV